MVSEDKERWVVMFEILHEGHIQWLATLLSAPFRFGEIILQSVVGKKMFAKAGSETWKFR